MAPCGVVLFCLCCAVAVLGEEQCPNSPDMCVGGKGDALLQMRSDSDISELAIAEENDSASKLDGASVQDYALDLLIDDASQLEGKSMREQLEKAVSAKGWNMELVDSMGEPETIATDNKGNVKQPVNVHDLDFPLKLNIVYRHRPTLELLQSLDDPLGKLTDSTCPRTNVTSWKWIGTAPFCGAEKSNCADIGWTFDHASKSGGGASCWTGEKVLCKSTKMGVSDKCNPECNGKFQVKVVGTSPACDATECDCLMTDPPMFPYRYGGQDGSVENPCSHRPDWRGYTAKPCYKTPLNTAQHVVCLAPEANLLTGSVSQDLAKAVESARQKCAGVKKMDEQNTAMLSAAAKAAIMALAR